jgi:methyltransferase family protein
MNCCPQGARCAGAARMFDQRVAARDLRRDYRRGPRKTSRLLISGLRSAGPLAGTLLDIGAGVGTMTRALLDSGVERAVAIDASPAYVAAGQQESLARGYQSRIAWRQGDFVFLADEIPSADVVTLDRVICCYPAYEELLDRALAHAGRYLGLTYPHDRWDVRWFSAVGNAFLRLTGNPFRAFVHPAAGIERAIRDRGFELHSRSSTLLWRVDVWRKALTARSA